MGGTTRRDPGTRTIDPVTSFENVSQQFDGTSANVFCSAGLIGPRIRRR